MKRYILISTILFCSLFLLYNSCIESYNPNLKGARFDKQLVVEGRITTKAEPYQVKLSRTVSVDTTYYFDPVENAEIRIHEVGGSVAQLSEIKPGIYQTTDKNFIGKAGHTYSLEIITNDGKEYESNDITIIPAPEIDKVYFEELEDYIYINDIKFPIKKLKILLDSSDPSNQCKHLKWEYQEGWQHNIEAELNMDDAKRYCWKEDISKEILIGTSENLSTSRILNKEIKTISSKDTRLRRNYGIFIKQYSLSKNTYEYWKKLQEINQNSGSIHDKMPYSVYGNITCCSTSQKALGYFEASDIKEKFFKIKRTDHNLRAEYPFKSCDYDTLAKEADNNPYNDASVIHYQHERGEAFILGILKQEMGRESWIVSQSITCTDCRETANSKKPDFWQ
ncbi:DUF4249 domain-containing protein [Prolixibacteraceae bacterium JC049]|nr:DUF4249 domain-containing protein [Prolixibacteraceae bacterium JC049]